MNLQLLGVPQLAGTLLEPIRAALLAHLAMEGPTPRARLKELLWPGQRWKTAGNNLSQHLTRLRGEQGEPYVIGPDPLKLSDALWVDVRQLLAAHDRQDHRAALQYTGKLLEGVEFDAAERDAAGDVRYEELSAWLEQARLHVRQVQRRAHLSEIERLERMEDLHEALELARRLLSMDNAQEEAWSAVIQLQWRMEDRTSARDTYRTCKEVLRKLGVPLSEELGSLGKLLCETPTPAHPIPARRPLPPKVMHPPVLVGREREWAQIEAAWEARRPVFVFGERGMGKSRLMADFAQARGQWLQLEAMPSDQETLWATDLRNGRKLMELRRKDGRPPPPDWIMEQLQALHPELGAGRGALRGRPMDRLRFFEAAAELFADTCRDIPTVVFDNGQYIDRASYELGAHIHNTLLGRSSYPLILSGWRKSAMDVRHLNQIGEAAGLEKVAVVDLSPLSTQDVEAMLRSMEVPGLDDRRVRELAAFTGGNPLFVVEMVKLMLEAGWPDGMAPSSLPRAEPVKHVIRERLRALSRAARDVARVVAVARADVALDVVAQVLDVPPMRLAEPYRELESRGILAGGWFTHDLLGEVLLEEVPGQLKLSLQQALARHFPPGR